MNGDRLSATTRSLLKSARADAPSTAARAKVWSGVSGTVGGMAGAGAGASGLGASGAASTSAAKLLAAGTLLGGVVTVGLAALLLHVGPAPRQAPPASTAAAFAASLASPQPPSRLREAPAPALDTAAPGLNTLPGVDAPGHAGKADGTSSPVARGASGATGSCHGAARKSKRPVATTPPASRPSAGDDALTREASLVAGARTALASGSAEEALRLVRAARAMPSPQLVPEELTVEAQALRSLGKADEARGVDATLHAQFPDSALAR